MRLDELGQAFVAVRLVMRPYSIKTGTRRIMRLNELCSILRLKRRTTDDSSSRRIMRLVPVFILRTHNRTNNKC
jgi:hypothetical protein